MAVWGFQGSPNLHTRGSIEAFTRISSPEKWLYAHGRKKWETYYGADAVATQKRFFDHYLKGEDNGWRATPRVRIEVRNAYHRQDVRYEARWPLADTRFVPLYLDAAGGHLHIKAVTTEAHVAYDAIRGQVVFSLALPEAVELTGEAKLRIWVSTSDGDDLDLFVVLKKFDEHGQEVFFSGFNGYRKDAVAKGWLRVSHRALDPSRNRPPGSRRPRGSKSGFSLETQRNIRPSAITASSIAARIESIAVGASIHTFSCPWSGARFARPSDLTYVVFVVAGFFSAEYRR